MVHQLISLQGNRKSLPAQTALLPSSSSILSSWLYLASRSEREGAPVLIWPVESPTTRSAMKLSSVSPERWETITPQLLSLLCSQAWMLSVRVPIWLTFSRRALQDFFWMPVAMRCGLVTRRSSPTICTFSPSCCVMCTQPSQSSWSKGSSIDTTGYFSTQPAQTWYSSLLDRCGTDFDSFSSLKCRSYFLVPSLQNSEAAMSIPICTIPSCPAEWIADFSSSSASQPSLTVGANPPSSPTLVALSPYFFLMIFMRWWYTSEPALIACVKLCAPVGRIMNSCMARPLPPCLPPFITLKEGVGSTYCDLFRRLVRDLMCSQRGTLRAAAPALATARDTERMALAPSLFLQKPYSLEVPSSSFTIRLSMSVCRTGSHPFSAGEITFSTLPTALETPFPMYSLFTPSLSSSASYLPVEAPEGTAALKTPRSVMTSASMVGLPLESKICLALICLMEEACRKTLLVRYLSINQQNLKSPVTSKGYQQGHIGQNGQGRWYWQQQVENIN